MTTISLRRNYAHYSKVDKEDPEEASHRRAQFLIYKVLGEADHCHSKSRNLSFLRIRFCKMRIKIGKGLRRLRKCILVSISAARARIALYKQLTHQLKTWKRLFGHQKGETIAASLPPLFN